MTLNLSMPGYDELKPRITVFGVGGAGGNAVDNMIDKNLDGVDFVVGNTDAQALQQSKSETRIQLGVKVTEGLGAGARASVGAAARREYRANCRSSGGRSYVLYHCWYGRGHGNWGCADYRAGRA